MLHWWRLRLNEKGQSIVMRLRNMPRTKEKSLTAALTAHVQGSLHMNAVVTETGHWLANGRRDENGTCHGDNAAECAILEQARLLGRFLVALEKVRYAGDITVLTTSADVVGLLTDWRSGFNGVFDWCGSDLQHPRRQLRHFKGSLTVMQVADDRPLITLARELSQLVFDGLSGKHDRQGTERRVRRLVAESLG